MTTTIASLVADNLDLWTSATQRKSGAGRGGGKRIRLYGIERLRALILDLAVRGKLVPQDAGDESVEARYKNLPKSVELPQNWHTLNFGKYCDIQGGNQPPKSQFIDSPREGYIQLIQIRDLGENPVPTYIPIGSTNRFCKAGEILIGRYGASVGKIFWADDGAYNVALAKFLWPEDALIAAYAFLLLKSNYLQATLASASRSAQAGFNKGDLAGIDFPLPPLAEQRRIVAKVDELMALCDALERESADAMAAHQALVEELLATLVNSADAAALSTNWARLESHFDTLFTTDASIDALKQTILDLAVRGKLVEQDAGDEAAKILLQKLKSEKQALIVNTRAGSNKGRQKHLIEEELFAVPSSWTWTRLGELTETITSGSRDWSKYLSSHGAKFVTMGNLSRGSYDLRFEKMHYVQIGNDREGTRTSLQAGDLLVSITGDVGNMALIPEGFGEAYINQHTAMLRFLPSVQGRFLPELLRSPLAQKQFNEPQRGVKNSFRLSDIQNIRVPLPPLAEQHRIVAKVDALMAHCDALKARLADAATTQKHLADAITERAAA